MPRVDFLATIAAPTVDPTAPDVHAGQPLYVSIGASVVVACLLAGLWLAVLTLRKDKEQRARHRLSKEQAKARLEAAQAASPSALFAEPAAVLSGDGESTTVILLPRNGGRHAAPVGVARLPLNMPRLLRRRDGSVRA